MLIVYQKDMFLGNYWEHFRKEKKYELVEINGTPYVDNSSYCMRKRIRFH